MTRLSGRHALITGAANGIGAAMARRFCAEGASVTLGDIDAARGSALAVELQAQGAAAHFVSLDVTDEASVQQAMADGEQRHGALHILVNNAGGSSMNDNTVVDFDLEEFWRAIRIDLLGTVLGCRHAIPRIAAAGGGAVLNMGSIAALRGLQGRDAYTAAKGGVHALTRSMAVEFAGQGVRCNAIAPGAVLSERMTRFIAEDPRVATAVSRHLLGLPEPEEIAAMAVFLCSEESRHVTGAIFQVDGGRAASA